MLKDTIRRLRTAKNLTQKQIAEAIGVSAAAVTQWETGGGIDMPNLRKLAKALGVPAKVLMEETNDTPSQESDQSVELTIGSGKQNGNNAHVPGTGSIQEGKNMGGDDGVSGELKDAFIKDLLRRVERLEHKVLDQDTRSPETVAGPQKRRKGV